MNPDLKKYIEESIYDLPDVELSPKLVKEIYEEIDDNIHIWIRKAYSGVHLNKDPLMLKQVVEYQMDMWIVSEVTPSSATLSSLTSIGTKITVSRNAQLKIMSADEQSNPNEE